MELESIRAQTYPRDRLETIVVADGSGDASAAIARSFQVRHGMQGTVLVGRSCAAVNPLARRGATKMIARGESDLADGNIAVARQFFLRAAEAGVARGAAVGLYLRRQ